MRRLSEQSARLLVVMVTALCVSSAQGAEVPLAGKWKLLLPMEADQAVVILSIEGEAGALKGNIADAQRFMSELKVDSLKQDGNTLQINFLNGPAAEKFTGTIPQDDKKPITGSFSFRGAVFPAELQRTEDEKVESEFGKSEVGLKIMQASRGVVNPQKKIENLRAVIAENPGHARLQTAYAQILRAARPAELPMDEVRQVIADWRAAAAPYGPTVAAMTEATILASLPAGDDYKDLRFEMAQAAAKSLPADVSGEVRAQILQMLLAAATAVGNEAVVTSTKEELTRLEDILDAEYLQKVPPFTVKIYEGRPDAAQNRVMLVELFTGAECPPCVAVDVAFDGLIETYKPAEMIGLQYHLHIPGPDPLANADTLARSQYYGVQGTPSTYINGEMGLNGGGGMAASEQVYNLLTDKLNKALTDKRLAAIDLKVKRDGDKVLIDAAATIDPAAAEAAKPAAGDKGEAKTEEGAEKPAEKEQPAAPNYRLRLAVIEEAVRYVGGNKLRFHHHVVRGMPGGAEGKEITGDKGNVQATVDLNELRGGLEGYLKEFSSSREFPRALPPIENKELSIVAFVQNDADKRILDAVLVAVPEK